MKKRWSFMIGGVLFAVALFFVLGGFVDIFEHWPDNGYQRGLSIGHIGAIFLAPTAYLALPVTLIIMHPGGVNFYASSAGILEVYAIFILLSAPVYGVLGYFVGKGLETRNRRMLGATIGCFLFMVFAASVMPYLSGTSVFVTAIALVCWCGPVIGAVLGYLVGRSLWRMG